MSGEITFTEFDQAMKQVHPEEEKTDPGPLNPAFLCQNGGKICIKPKNRTLKCIFFKNSMAISFFEIFQSDSGQIRNRIRQNFRIWIRNAE